MKAIKLTPKMQKKLLAQMQTKMQNLSFRDGESIKLDWSLDTDEGPEVRPIITFTEAAYRTINALVEQCSKEIAWNAQVTKTVSEDGAPIFVVDEVIMFPQQVTGTSVDVDETEYSNWCSTLDTDVINKLRFHGHSHVNMAVNPSGIDTDYQRQMIDQIPDFFIFMIFNKRGDNYACIYDVEHNVFYEDKDIDLVVPTLPEEEFAKLADTLIEEYVKQKTINSTAYPAKKNVPTTGGAGRIDYGDEYDDFYTGYPYANYGTGYRYGQNRRK